MGMMRRYVGVLIGFIVLVMPGWVVAQAQGGIASLDPVQGLIQHQGALANPQDAAQWTTVTGRVLVNEGDRIRTDGVGLAYLTFFDGAQTQIGPNTLVIVSTLVLPDAASPNFDISLDVLVGSTLTNINATLSPNDRIEVHTPGATATVRGTRWWTIVQPDGSTTFFSEQGRVEVIPHQEPGQLAETGAECLVETDQRGVAVRVGPGPDRAVRTTFPVHDPIRVTGQATGSDGARWWRIDLRGIRQAWVAQADVTASGDCEAVPNVLVPLPEGVAPAPGVRAAVEAWFELSAGRSLVTDRSGAQISLGERIALPIPPRAADLAAADCGDAICQRGEIRSCPLDCRDQLQLANCGNGICEPDSGEDLLLCAQDCGPWAGEACGNGTCDADESGVTCPADCAPDRYFDPVNPALCGNETCDATESALNCPADCAAPAEPRDTSGESGGRE
jgi:hypothetical protein